jgi:hypothetical protein
MGNTPEKGEITPKRKVNKRKSTDIRDIPSSKPIEGKYESIVVNSDIIPEVATFNPGEPPVKIEGGTIRVDKTALEKEKKNVVDFVKSAIESGNEAEVKKFLWYFEDSTDQESLSLIYKIKEALAKKDASNLKLDELRIGLATEGIAQRRLIKEGLAPEIKKYPFDFLNEEGNKLDKESDIDYIFTKKGKDEFKMIIASKKGISSISVPDNIQSDQFQPDLINVSKDQETGAILIPLKDAKNGTTPSVSMIEIRKEKVNLPDELVKEQERLEEKRKKEEEENNYTPPPAAPQSRSSRPTRWVSTSN